MSELVYSKLSDYGFTKNKIIKNLEMNMFNHITTSYHLILNRIKYEKYLEIMQKRSNEVFIQEPIFNKDTEQKNNELINEDIQIKYLIYY